MLSGKKGVPLEYLKLATNRFEEQIIYCLDLSNKQIVALGDVGKCTSLVILNVSRNALASLDGISTLESLSFFNCSHNLLKDLSSLASCPNLIRIDAMANEISDSMSLKSLATLQQLKVLNLQNIRREEINPVCREEGYRQITLKLLPKLLRLDFMPKGAEFEQPAAEEEIKLDTTKLVVKRAEMYGEFDELERMLNEEKKNEAKNDVLVQRVTESQTNCKKKQEKTDELIKELEKLLS
jgi:hypothetical protein